MLFLPSLQSMAPHGAKTAETLEHRTSRGLSVAHTQCQCTSEHQDRCQHDRRHRRQGLDGSATVHFLLRPTSTFGLPDTSCMPPTGDCFGKAAGDLRCFGSPGLGSCLCRCRRHRGSYRCQNHRGSGQVRLGQKLGKLLNRKHRLANRSLQFNRVPNPEQGRKEQDPAAQHAGRPKRAVRDTRPSAEGRWRGAAGADPALDIVELDRLDGLKLASAARSELCGNLF
mmetsp:Transcript_43346/g.137045  ORF Transcript_43346/g.137045 Transcript_43346/m.137045 type:complete len:226 (-) Transcript_43346:586-1263(-)